MAVTLLTARPSEQNKLFTLRSAFSGKPSGRKPLTLPITVALANTISILRLAHRERLPGVPAVHAVRGDPAFRRFRFVLGTRAGRPAAVELVVAVLGRFEGVAHRETQLFAIFVPPLEIAVGFLFIACALLAVPLVTMRATRAIRPVIVTLRIRLTFPIIGVVFVADRDILFIGVALLRVKGISDTPRRPLALRLASTCLFVVKRAAVCEALVDRTVPKAITPLAIACRFSMLGEQLAIRFASVVARIITASFRHQSALGPVAAKMFAIGKLRLKETRFLFHFFARAEVVVAVLLPVARFAVIRERFALGDAQILLPFEIASFLLVARALHVCEAAEFMTHRFALFFFEIVIAEEATFVNALFDVIIREFVAFRHVVISVFAFVLIERDHRTIGNVREGSSVATELQILFGLVRHGKGCDLWQQKDRRDFHGGTK